MISFSINLLVKCYCKLSKVFSDACIFKEHARFHEPLGNQEIAYSPPLMNTEWLESCFKWVGGELTANSSCIFRSFCPRIVWWESLKDAVFLMELDVSESYVFIATIYIYSVYTKMLLISRGIIVEQPILKCLDNNFILISGVFHALVA